MPRQYEPIWIALKALPKDQATKVGVSITSPRALHRRIVKAMKKEKWMDVGYKIQIEPYASELVSTSRHSILTFKLVFKRVTSYTSQDF